MLLSDCVQLMCRVSLGGKDLGCTKLGNLWRPRVTLTRLDTLISLRDHRVYDTRGDPGLPLGEADKTR